MSSVKRPCMRMYSKPHSRCAMVNCRCQSARKPSFARPAPTQNLNIVLSGPFVWCKSAEMSRGVSLVAAVDKFTAAKNAATQRARQTTLGLSSICSVIKAFGRRHVDVAQICNLPYRRIASGRRLKRRATGGLQIRDTEECNSGLLLASEFQFPDALAVPCSLSSENTAWLCGGKCVPNETRSSMFSFRQFQPCGGGNLPVSVSPLRRFVNFVALPSVEIFTSVAVAE